MLNSRIISELGESGAVIYIKTLPVPEKINYQVINSKKIIKFTVLKIYLAYKFIFKKNLKRAVYNYLNLHALLQSKKISQINNLFPIINLMTSKKNIFLISFGVLNNDNTDYILNIITSMSMSGRILILQNWDEVTKNILNSKLQQGIKILNYN